MPRRVRWWNANHPGSTGSQKVASLNRNTDGTAISLSTPTAVSPAMSTDATAPTPPDGGRPDQEPRRPRALLVDAARREPGDEHGLDGTDAARRGGRLRDRGARQVDEAQGGQPDAAAAEGLQRGVEAEEVAEGGG